MPEQVAQARLFTRSVLHDRPEVETATLVVSELATNALRHTASGGPGGAFTVSVAVRSDGVMIAVDDLGSQTSEPAAGEDADTLAISGRGLPLVAAIAKEWGIAATKNGRCVWAELRGGDEPGVG
ncbi:MAG: ATP-binding protein [Streptosporangiaceae bacterium]